MNVVLDADVVIGALDSSDPHHKQAQALFSRWRRQRATRVISVVNLSEVLIAPAADAERLRTAREALAALGIVVHPAGATIAVAAARLRGRYPISLPDAYCLATARHIDGVVASFDRKVTRAATAERLVRRA